MFRRGEEWMCEIQSSVVQNVTESVGCKGDIRLAASVAFTGRMNNNKYGGDNSNVEKWYSNRK